MTVETITHAQFQEHARQWEHVEGLKNKIMAPRLQDQTAPTIAKLLHRNVSGDQTVYRATICKETV
jgi:hypothetical protein